jgi:hypothetical protein
MSNQKISAMTLATLPLTGNESIPVDQGGNRRVLAGSLIQQPSFVFADSGTQDVAAGRYTSWADLMAKLATVQIGAAPVIVVALTVGPFVVPLAGMPVDGWDLRGGTLRSFYRATGAVVLELPAGVKLNNCFGIDDGLVLTIEPGAGTGVLEWTALPAQAPRIFQVGDGCYIRNNDAGALMRSKGDQPGGTTHVLVAFSSAFAVADPPVPAGAKLVHLSADGGQNADGIVLVQGQSALGGLPTDCVENSGAANVAIVIYDICANPLTPNMALWQPSFTGTVVFSYAVANPLVLPYDDLYITPPLGATSVQASLDALKNATKNNAQGLLYAPAYAGDWDTSDPTNVRDALDRLANAVAGLLGTPIP